MYAVSAVSKLIMKLNLWNDKSNTYHCVVAPVLTLQNKKRMLQMVH